MVFDILGLLYSRKEKLGKDSHLANTGMGCFSPPTVYKFFGWAIWSWFGVLGKPVTTFWSTGI